MKDTTATIVALFIENCQSAHTAESAKYRLRAFSRWIESEFGITEVEQVEARHVLAYKTHLSKSGMAPTSQARVIQNIRAFFHWLHAEGIIPTDPARNVKAPRAELNKEPTYLETDETRRLFEAIPNGRHARRDRAILWVLALGLRVSEVTNLNVCDLILPNGNGLAGLRVHGKRSYERIIPLPHAAHDALTDYLGTRHDAPNDAPLFVGNYGGDCERRLSVDAVQKWFKNLVDAAGLPREKAHPHAARHGAAMRWIYESTAPGGIFTVSRLLGHSSISTTQRYLHVGPQGRAAMESAVMSDPLAVCPGA